MIAYVYLIIWEKFNPWKDVVHLQYENVCRKDEADPDNWLSG